MNSWFRQISELLSCIVQMRPHLRGGRYLIAAVVLTSLLSAILEGIGVSMLVPLLSLLLGGEDTVPMRPIDWLRQRAPGHPPSFYVMVFCLLVLGCIVGKNIVYYISQVLAGRLKARISVNLRRALFERLHRADLQYFEQRTSGELANAFLTETHRTLSTVDFLLLFGQRSSILCFYLVGLVIISWQLTLGTVVLAAIIGLLVGSSYRKLRSRGVELTALNQQLATCLSESFSGVRLVRSTNSQEREAERFRKLSEAQAEVEQRSSRAGSLLVPIVETVAVAGGILIIAGAYIFLVQNKAMLPSHLLGFGFILLRLLPLLNQLYVVQGHLFYLASAVLEIRKWLEIPEHPTSPFGAKSFPGLSEGLRFENVSYQYPNGTSALENLSFSLKLGQTVALVGASGSGKSTVAALLLRFRQPATGLIKVDGEDYWQYTAKSWHEKVAVVEQEAFLFNDTIRNNIAYGFPHVTADGLQEAIRKAHLTDVIKGLPNGLDTIVGERGAMLSGGQRQRMAIARALVRNPQVLILDEATSSLDNLSEAVVQKALEEAQVGRTVLVIAHRLSTIRNADHIVVLDKGRVVEQGTWAELEAREGFFMKLVQTNNTLVAA